MQSPREGLSVSLFPSATARSLNISVCCAASCRSELCHWHSVSKTAIVCLNALWSLGRSCSFGRHTCDLIKSHQSNFNLLNQSVSLKKIGNFLIHAVISGGQGASHCSAAGCMFTSRKMQHHSWKKIQRREVDGDPFLSLNNKRN